MKREFKIYTDDENLIGIHDIKLNAHLETYREITAPEVQTTIEIFDACPEPQSVTATQ